MAILSLLKNLIVRKLNKDSLKELGFILPDSVIVHGRIRIYGSGKIYIGDNSRINSGEKYNPIGGANHTSFSLRNGGEIIIGRNVGISNSAFVSQRQIIVEDDVRIGGNCKIYDTDFHSIRYEYRMKTPDNNIKSCPIRICKGAFIGAHCIILKGVRIGEKSVVGAGSVVTKSIPDGEIWAGNPAHFIKKIEQ